VGISLRRFFDFARPPTIPCGRYCTFQQCSAGVLAGCIGGLWPAAPLQPPRRRTPHAPLGAPVFASTYRELLWVFCVSHACDLNASQAAEKSLHHETSPRSGRQHIAQHVSAGKPCRTITGSSSERQFFGAPLVRAGRSRVNPTCRRRAAVMGRILNEV
jgi:hypothetical protein